MSMASEFKAFLLRGNIIDIAVGIVIGVAFKDVVKSLVDDVIMPPIGWVLGGVNFNKLKWVLQEAGADGKGGVAIGYGAFINTVITFIIIAFVVFVMIKGINKMHKKQEEAPAAPAEDVVLLTEIRDLLQKDRAV